MNADTTINLSNLAEVSMVVPALKAALERIERIFERFAAMSLPTGKGTSDGWMDANQARQYMGDMSKGTFDKYRYQTSPRIKGYKVGGKTFYKQSDLDSFVRLYEIKSSGLA